MSAAPAAVAGFDPTSLGLPKDFLLTDYTRLKGCSCKIPHKALLKLLETLNPGRPEADVGMDCSIVPLRYKAAGPNGGEPEELFQVSTCDFFAPSVEDPYLQGRIACANVLSDLYALGVTRCDSLLMILAQSIDMEESERFTTTLEIMRGFTDAARDAKGPEQPEGVQVTGGQSIQNPWPLIGGTGMSVVRDSEMIRPDRVMVGDVLVLTKPLGAQLAVNLQQWKKRPTPLFVDHIKGKMSDEEIQILFDSASGEMARLNLTAALLMKQFGAHSCTDVTGFGLRGHAENLIAAQSPRLTNIQARFDRLPMYAGAIKGEKLLNNKYGLLQGKAAETSGGLLIAFPDEAAATKFIQAFAVQEPTAKGSWLIGKVIEKPAGDLASVSIPATCEYIAV